MHSSSKHDYRWMLGAVLFVALVLLGVRFSSSILQSGYVFDEQYITTPINDLIEQGWSVQTAIDFEETKGPAMIWPYAFFGELMGGSLNALRMVSVLSSIACMAVIAFIASICGVRRSGHLAVAAGWLLLPYTLVFSEIVMGEISFILIELLIVAVYLHARNHSNLYLPILFGLLVAVALHSRIHVVALVGGICIVALLRNGIRSWPWWVAGAVAGLLRIPLWIRWEGLVSPKYQNLHGFGFRIESLSYLIAALAPFVGIFAVYAWRKQDNHKWLFGAAAVGALLVFVAAPDLFVPSTIDYDNPTQRFQGVVGTAVKLVTGDPTFQKILLALFAAVGLAGLVGMQRTSHKEIVTHISFYTLSLGCLLYVFTQGFVFDRFIMVWAFLLPIVWWKQLPKTLFVLQSAAMMIITVRLACVWL
jgi:hypothetical protein